MSSPFPFLLMKGLGVWLRRKAHTQGQGEPERRRAVGSGVRAMGRGVSGRRAPASVWAAGGTRRDDPPSGPHTRNY